MNLEWDPVNELWYWVWEKEDLMYRMLPENDYSSNYYQLSTGRTLYVNLGYIGLASNGGQWELTQGYDGRILAAEGPASTSRDDPFPLTGEERIELAEYMIDQWTAYKAEQQTALSSAGACGIVKPRPEEDPT